MKKSVVSLGKKGRPSKRRKLLSPSALEESEELHEDLDEELDEDLNEELDEELNEELEDSQNSEGEASEDDEKRPESDPHTSHFSYELPENLPTDKLQYQKEVLLECGELGTMAYHRTNLLAPECGNPTVGVSSPSELGLKKNLADALRGSGELTELQTSFLRLLTGYWDVSYMQRTYRRGEALRKVYTLHILNHILKSRAKIVRHNAKLAKNPDDEFRDQGFTRPLAVILAPFRHDCHRVVDCLVRLLPPGCVVSNRKRFEKEYGPPPKVHKMKPKPDDYKLTFEGNIDEDFKIGLSIKNKSVALYSEFYKSDLIIASPLGLRQALGSEGEKGGDCDFLSSVEILVLDRVDVLYLQNLVHLLHVLRQFNAVPRQSRGCDFSRVRQYACEGLARLYRQTIALSAVEHRWFEGVIPRAHCANYKGYLCSAAGPRQGRELGVNSQVFVTLKMCIRIFDFPDPAKEFDSRFDFFVNRVLPEFQDDPDMSQTLVFVPSYFDFVRLRNHLREKEVSATMICEYSSPGKVAEARNNFFKGRRQFMLYTERAHFYNRYNLKGIQHLLFYQLPTYPSFHRDLQFSLLDGCPGRQHEPRSCTVLASSLDLLQLKPLVGLEKAKALLTSEEKVFVRQILK